MLLTVAVPAKRRLVYDAFDRDALGAEMFSTIVAEAGVLVAGDGAAIFTDGARGFVAERTFCCLVPDHFAGGSL